MFLKMSKVVQSPPHNKLIEQDNKSQEKKDKEYSKVVLSLVLKTLSGAALDSLEQVLGFRNHNEIKHYSCYGDRNECQDPTHYLTQESSLLRVVYVLPFYLAGLVGSLYAYLTLEVAEVLPYGLFSQDIIF